MPKGVDVPHRTMLGKLLLEPGRMGMGVGSKVAQVLSISFAMGMVLNVDVELESLTRNRRVGNAGVSGKWRHSLSSRIRLERNVGTGKSTPSICQQKSRANMCARLTH